MTFSEEATVPPSASNFTPPPRVYPVPFSGVARNNICLQWKGQITSHAATWLPIQSNTNKREGGL